MHRCASTRVKKRETDQSRSCESHRVAQDWPNGSTRWEAQLEQHPKKAGTQNRPDI